MRHLIRFLIVGFFFFLFVFSAKAATNADLNSDSKVDIQDLGILLSYWNSTLKPSADLNQDGIVNSVDFGIMMSGRSL